MDPASKANELKEANVADDEWISGSQLVKIALPLFESEASLKDWLLFRLSKGLIVSRATSTLLRQDGAQPAVRLTNWDIPPQAWSFISMGHDAMKIEVSADLERISGRFPTSFAGLDYGLRHFESEGLSFLRRDLVAILGPRSSPLPPAARAGVGGAKPDKLRWGQFAAALAAIAAKDDFQPNDDPSEIFRKVDDLLAFKGLPGFDKSNVIGAIELALEWAYEGKD